MKKTKKMLALLLALVMAFAMMAVTASAFDAEDGHVHTEACSEEGSVQRRLPAGICPVCGMRGTYIPTDYGTYKTYYYTECGHTQYIYRS